MSSNPQSESREIILDPLGERIPYATRGNTAGAWVMLVPGPNPYEECYVLIACEASRRWVIRFIDIQELSLPRDEAPAYQEIFDGTGAQVTPPPPWLEGVSQSSFTTLGEAEAVAREAWARHNSYSTE